MISPIDNGRVLCGEKGIWTDVEDCFHCPAFQTIKSRKHKEFVVCKTTADTGLWSTHRRTVPGIA